MDVSKGNLIKPKAEHLPTHPEEASDDDDDQSKSSSLIDRLADDGDGEIPMLGLVPVGSTRIIDGESSIHVAEDSDEENFSPGSNDEPSILPQQSILQDTSEQQGKLRATIRRRMDPYSSTATKAKRVLSSNTLSTLNAEAGHKDDSPKRMRTSPEMGQQTLDDLPELSLGLSVMDAIQPLRSRSLRRSPVISSGDDEELDRALSEELKRPSQEEKGDKSPVPLLTPPQSPLTIPGDQEQGLVEWPSNLVIDSAMMSATTNARPLSPASLQKFEAEEERRLKDACSRPDPSTLTPLLRSIQVGTK